MKLEHCYFACALQHIINYGDTDIFPHPFELKFLGACEADVVKALGVLDLNQYHPMSLLETLVPKSKFGFRTAHQPFSIDTVIFTALVMRIFDSVEQGRDPKEKNRAFSYRKINGLDSNLLHPNRTYKDWLNWIACFVFSEEYSHVIRTDISDFYSRIYRIDLKIY